MYFTYEVESESCINRWMVSKLFEKKYIGKMKAFERDDSLVGGDWSKIFSPLRKEYIDNEKFKHRYSADNIEKFYVPFENEKVEYSGFWFEPHELEFYAKGYIISEEEVDLPLELTTCGSVAIFVNKEKITEFSPFNRNIGSKCEITLPIKSGKNEVIISCKDLAERDTFNYFQLKNLSKKSIKIELPVKVDIEKFNYLERYLHESHLEKENYLKEEIKLILPHNNEKEFKYTINTTKNLDSAQLLNKTKKLSLKKGEKSIVVGNSKDYSLGFHKVVLTAYLDGISISREFSVEIYPVTTEKMVEASIDERKKKALDFLRENGQNSLPKVFTLIDGKGELEENGKKVLFSEVDKINRREDCSDFRMPALIWLYKKKRSLLNKEEIDIVEKTILNYRYWMDEPGNDVMWFFSENHALAFHTSELLAGELFPDKIFTNSGMTGKEHILKSKELLNNWFDKFNEHGYGEWNSAVYLPIDMISCFSLYELSDDKKIKEKAKKVLDRTFDIFAKNSYHGVITSSQGRAYEKELRGRRTTSSSGICWIAWGEGYLNQSILSTALFAISTYEPPEHLKDIALYNNENGIIIRDTEGPDRANLYMYKSKDFSMGTVIDYKNFIPGHQEHVFQANIGDTPESQIWINHPGEKKINGVGRPSYFAGNGYLPKITQEKDRATLEYSIAEDHEVDFTHAYTPLEYFDEYRMMERWFFLRKKSGFIGIFVENGYELTTSGPLKDREIKSYGKKNKWTVQIGSVSQWGNFNNFINNCIH